MHSSALQLHCCVDFEPCRRTFFPLRERSAGGVRIAGRRKAWLEVVGTHLRLREVENPCALAAPEVFGCGGDDAALAALPRLPRTSHGAIGGSCARSQATAHETFSSETKLDVTVTVLGAYH